MRKFILKSVLGIILLILGLAGIGWLAFVPSATEPDYRMVTAWGQKGEGPGQFNDPTGIAIADGEVFVSDARNGRIQVFDLAGKFLRSFGTTGDKPGELGRPMNLTIAGQELYVPEYFNDRIQVFGLDGTPLRIVGEAGDGPARFNAPGGVAVTGDGSLIIADFYNQRIQKLTASGAFIRQWGETGQSGRGAGQFSYPTDVALAADGTLYVADGYNDRVQVFDKDGAFLRKWGGPFALNIHGPFRGWFTTVTGIALDGKGNVFVADFYNHRVQKFNRGGQFLTSFGVRGTGDGQFFHPVAVAVAPDNSVYVADFGNNRIQVWRQDK